MPTIVTPDGRIDVPKEREPAGDGEHTNINMVSVKVSGWVKYRKNGEIHHIPPSQVLRIEENDPRKDTGLHGGSERIQSNVSYQNPHGSI